MRKLRAQLLFLVFALVFAIETAGQEQKIRGADERYKTDILVVVAHPDDEGAVLFY